jgi:hypothetical protein
MLNMQGVWISMAALLVPAAQAQQPVGIQIFTNYTGLTDSCKAALSTNVTCPPFLAIVSQR